MAGPLPGGKIRAGPGRERPGSGQQERGEGMTPSPPVTEIGQGCQLGRRAGKFTLLTRGRLNQTDYGQTDGTSGLLIGRLGGPLDHRCFVACGTAVLKVRHTRVTC